MKKVATVAELVSVVDADDHGSVFLFADGGKVAVAYESFDADVVASVTATEQALGKAEDLLKEKGIDVFLDAEAWREQLNEWYQMGGGEGKAW